MKTSRTITDNTKASTEAFVVSKGAMGRPSAINTPVLIAVSLLLFLAGYLAYDMFFQIRSVQLNGARLQSYDPKSRSMMRLLFSLILSLLPILCITVWKRGDMQSPVRRTMAVLMVMGCGAFSVVLRKIWMQKQLSAQFTFPNPYSLAALNNFQLELFLLLGFFTGAVISLVVFRQR